ncbi:MAG: MarR family transcriptional regulator [Burkholderiaceae bacterium]|nr:MAG: MarR family transcriptional regulator [Burkholderiaceae bacterium]
MSNTSDPRQRAWARFVTAQAMLLERIEAALAAQDLPPLAWYDVLWILECAEGGRLRMNDLARRAVISRSNVTRLTDRMEKAGLVTRSESPEDGRGIVCSLTTAGRKMRARMWPVYCAQIDTLFGSQMNAREAVSMAEVLEKIIQNMQS